MASCLYHTTHFRVSGIYSSLHVLLIPGVAPAMWSVVVSLAAEFLSVTVLLPRLKVSLGFVIVISSCSHLRVFLLPILYSHSSMKHLDFKHTYNELWLITQILCQAEE